MNETPKVVANQSAIRSGPQVIADFLEEMKSVEGIDRATVDSIHKLYRDDKLTWNNLVRVLEDARGE